MIPGMPILGIRFDIDKLASGAYGIAAWKIFWRAVKIGKLGPMLLFEGDTSTTLNGRENVYCIAIQSIDPGVLDAVKNALEENKEFSRVASTPKFVEGEEVIYEPLPEAGRIDASGTLEGDAWNARAGLNTVGDD
jgi:hypothetical protein